MFGEKGYNYYKIYRVTLDKEFVDEIIEEMVKYREITYPSQLEEIKERLNPFKVVYCDCSDRDFSEGKEGFFHTISRFIYIDMNGRNPVRTLLHEVVHLFQGYLYRSYDDYDFRSDMEEMAYNIAGDMKNKLLFNIRDMVMIENDPEKVRGIVELYEREKKNFRGGLMWG